jgi:hypothetical protein
MLTYMVGFFRGWSYWLLESDAKHFGSVERGRAQVLAPSTPQRRSDEP